MVNQVMTEEAAGKKVASLARFVPEVAGTEIRNGMELEASLESGQQSSGRVPA